MLENDKYKITHVCISAQNRVTHADANETAASPLTAFHSSAELAIRINVFMRFRKSTKRVIKIYDDTLRRKIRRQKKKRRLVPRLPTRVYDTSAAPP